MTALLRSGEEAVTSATTGSVITQLGTPLVDRAYARDNEEDP
jgi:hypothetical protein